MFDGVIFIFVCFLTFLLGIVLNKGLSATNIFKGVNEWTHDIPYIFTIGFNEMILIIYMTISIFTLFYIKYIISDSSRKQIKNMLDSILKIELLILSLFFARPNSLFLKSKATGNFLSYPSPDSFNLLLDPLNNTK